MIVVQLSQCRILCVIKKVPTYIVILRALVGTFLIHWSNIPSNINVHWPTYVWPTGGVIAL